jgi:hypothetical protein
MDLKDTQFITIFESSQDIVGEYPFMFEGVTVEGLPIYMEKPNPGQREGKSFYEEDRFFLLPSGMVSLLARDSKNDLWNIDEEDTGFFEELNKSIEVVNRERLNHEDPERYKTQNICGVEYGIKYYFYKDSRSSVDIVDELDKKELHWKGLPPRR